MAKSYTIRHGIICITEEIEITDYAVLLKYDWHLYNLSKDIRNARDKALRNYLKKAQELFFESVAKAKPSQRVDLFGNHSVFFYLYGHTSDWVAAAERKIQFEKDLLTCTSGDSVKHLIEIIRHSESQMEAQGLICKSFNVQPYSAKRILHMNYNQLAGIEESVLASSIEESKEFFKKVSELAKFEKETAL